MLKQTTLLARSYQRELLDPGYAVASSNPRWRNLLRDRLPRSPSDTLLLLDPQHPLRFNLLSYGDTFDNRHDFLIALQQNFHATIYQGQYHTVTPKSRTGLADSEVNSFCHILSLIDTGDIVYYQGYYLGAVLYRQRTSRKELTSVFGSLKDPQAYRTIRVDELAGALHFRVQPYSPAPSTKSKSSPYAVDFHLEPRRYDELASISKVRIREFRHPRHTHDDARQLCDCRDLLYSDLHHIAKSRRWKVPVDEYRGIFFYEV